MAFLKATKYALKLKMALEGPSGSGKSLTGLKLASGMCENPETELGCIDTENGKAALYAAEDGAPADPNKIPFRHSILAGDFSPKNYIDEIDAAQAAGIKVLLIDSLSHAWSGTGGVLELTDRAAKGDAGGNKFGGWRTTSPLHNKLVDKIVQSDMHIIATMRTHTEWVLEDKNGKKVPRKVGTKAVQRADFDYEFDVIGRLDQEHDMTIVKTRCSLIDNQVYNCPGPEFSKILLEWLKGKTAPAKAADEAVVKLWARDRYGLKNAAMFQVWLAEQKLTPEQAMERWRAEMAA